MNTWWFPRSTSHDLGGSKGGQMRPARFSYYRPDSVPSAAQILRDSSGAASVLAGGQSLVPLLNRRLARPSALVDLGWIPGLRYVSCDGAGLRIGAMTRHADIETDASTTIGSPFAILSEVAAGIGFRAVRVRGTIGGSVAYADPAAQWCLMAVLFGAEIVLRGPAGGRVVPARDFFTGAYQTAATSDEIVTEIRLPGPLYGAALVEHRLQTGAPPLVAAAAALDLDHSGAVTVARLALSGVADRPIRALGAEASLLGEIPRASLISQVARQLSVSLRPAADAAGSARDRAELAEVLAARALRESAARARASVRLPAE
jgi:aerobic carbon-monoxide dehydrogenase medium subunit